jgi:hypothetical protein
MAIIQTIDTASQFRDQFHRCGRGDQFSYEALGLLFDHLDSLGSDVELDVVGVCCEYAEESPEGIAKDYNFDLEGCEDESDISAAVLDYLHNETTVVGVTSTGSIVYEQF